MKKIIVLAVLMILLGSAGSVLSLTTVEQQASGLHVQPYTGASSGSSVSVTSYYWESGMSSAVPFDTIRASVSHTEYDTGQSITIHFSNSYTCSNPGSGMDSNSIGQLIFHYSSDSGENLPIYYANVSYTAGYPSTTTYHNVTLTFSSAFTFSFSVEVNSSKTDSYSFDNVSSVSEDIFVSNAPTVSISSNQPASGRLDTTQTVTFSSDISGGWSPYEYQWAYESSSATGPILNPISGQTGSTFTTSFTSPGSYNITVCVTDATGYEVYANEIQETVSYPPKLDLTSSRQSTDIGHEISFYANVSGGNGAISITWFLNGTSISNSGKYYNRTFSGAGNYTISAHAEDQADQWSNSSIIEYVYGHIFSSIQVSKTEIDMGQSVNFRFFPEGSTGVYLYSNFTLFDNTTSSDLLTGEGTQFNYSFPSYNGATYDVFLTWRAVSSDFAKTTSTIGLTIHDDPTVSVSTNRETNDVNDSIEFTANGPGPISGTVGEYGGWRPYRFVWFAEDMTNNTGWKQIGSQYGNSSSITTSFYPAGTYDIYVSVTDSAGYEVNSSVISVTIYPQLKAVLTSSPSTIVDLHCSELEGISTVLTYSNGGPTACAFESDENSQSDWFSMTKGPGNTYDATQCVPQRPGNYTAHAWVQNTIGDRVYTHTTTTVLPYDMSTEIHSPYEVISGEAISLSGSAQAPSSFTYYSAYLRETLYFSLTGFTYSWNISGEHYSGESVTYQFEHSGFTKISLTVRANYLTQIGGVDKSAYQQRSETLNVTVLNSTSNSPDILIKQFKESTSSSYDFTYWVTFKNSSYSESLITIGNETEEPSSVALCPNGTVFVNQTITDNQYSPGLYFISLTVINNLGQENRTSNQSFTISVAQSNQFSIYSIASFFGGFYNLLIFIVTVGGLVIGYASLKDNSKPPIVQIPEKNGKIVSYQLAGKRIKK
ncbi:hypothetical protein ACNF42_07275 [Cuniculiplasma sp. SKW3]|uniref:hypothetical protein n=1 Tax=Cuniculiplasma sp. SKW3 TaxID=3400170 RepID=UPI003FD0C76B